MSIDKLIQRGCSEEQIQQIANVSISDVRQAELRINKFVTTSLSKAAQAELLSVSKDRGLHDLASDYVTTYPHVQWVIGQQEEAVAFFVNDHTHFEIAKMFNVTRSRITQLAKNVEQKQNHSLTDEDWEKIKDAVKRQTISSVSRRFNISRAAIYAQLRK